MKRWNVILELIADVDAPVGLEIGVAKGLNFFHVLDGKPDLYLYGVDPYMQFDGGDLFKSYSQARMDLMHDHVVRRLQNYGGRAELYRMPSMLAAPMFDDASLDFIFIDGNHMDVANDINLWRPKVKSGGYLMGHDYHHHILGDYVAMAVEQMLPQHSVGDNNVWYMRQP